MQQQSKGPWFPDSPGRTPGQPAAINPALAVSAYQLQTPHYALILDLDQGTYQARFNQLVSQGYRSIWVQGVSNGASPATLSGIFVRDGNTSDWYQWVGMDAAGYQTKFNEGVANHFKPIAVSGYQDVGGNRFGAIWLANPTGGYAGIHNATNAAYQAFVNTQSQAGYRPEVVDGYAVGASPRAVDEYISIWDNANTLPWVARHGLTSAQYQTEFTNWANQGYHPYVLSAYPINGTTYFAAYWVKDGTTDFIGRHNWQLGSLTTAAVSDAQHDYQPIVIESYDSGSTRNFAEVVIKKSRVWTATGPSDPNLKSFDDTVQSFMQTRNIPSASLAVTRNSRLVYARGYRWDYDGIDPVQPDSLFRIASVTKPLTSAGIMLLVQQGKLHLTDRLVNLIPMPAPIDARMNNITVLQLLQHLGGWNRDTTFDPMFHDLQVSGVQGVPLPISKQDIINYIAGQPLQFTPGTQMNYSNFGYLLLGRVIEAVSKQPYATYLQSAVFAPLGMQKMMLGFSEMEHRQAGEVSYYVSDPNLYQNMRQPGAPTNVMIPYGNYNLENMDSHGGWIASAVDLARFSTMFDATSSYPLLTKVTIDTIFAQPAIGANPDGSWYGCGWAVRTAGAGLNTWHNGSLPGTSTLMVRRNDGLNWVILFNQRDDVSDPTGSTYGNIDPLLHAAADAVTAWPTGDKFSLFNMKTLNPYLQYLPGIRK